MVMKPTPFGRLSQLDPAATAVTAASSLCILLEPAPQFLIPEVLWSDVKKAGKIAEMLENQYIVEMVEKQYIVHSK